MIRLRPSKKLAFVVVGAGLLAFLLWRLVRPMNIFEVTPAFERPIATQQAPNMFHTLRADECGACHRDIYEEWRTTIHSQAWTDPYFQVDWEFDGRQQICKNCHIPLDRQQEQRVVGFRDRDKWDPILEPNPEFDAQLQHEGVTCAACHLRDGLIVGVRGDTAAPHPVRRIDNGNEVCVRCHVVSSERWDSFFRFPPCGTVAEIQHTQGATPSDDVTANDTAALGCVDCHMPLIERSLVTGGVVRTTRQHLWRGGHNPQMVKNALDVRFDIESDAGARAMLTLTNIGAAHYVPTGTPDRHLTVTLRALDSAGKTLDEEQWVLKRTVMWRPVIVDLWDTRLPRNESRVYALKLVAGAATVEAEVRYHLLDESRRRRIGYRNTQPIDYEVYRNRIAVTR